MKASGDLVIGTSGDRKSKSLPLMNADMRGSGKIGEKPTTAARRHRERSRDHRIPRSTSALITKTMRILRATLREIFDESAYDRFLQRTKVPRSVTSYRDFMQEREAGMTRRPKCC